MSRFTEGQKVLHVWSGGRYPDGSARRNVREVTVVKIGRKLAHVDHGYGRTETYRLDTGYATKDFGGRIATQEDLDAEDRARAAAIRLREEYGITRMGGRRPLPADATEQVLELLDRLALEEAERRG